MLRQAVLLADGGFGLCAVRDPPQELEGQESIGPCK